MLPEQFRLKTHEQVFGTTQSGKSFYLADCMIKLALKGKGFCCMEPHGTLIELVLSHLAYYRLSKKVHILDLSTCDFINPINPFFVEEGWDVTAYASATAELILKCWGDSLDDMPTFERTVTGLLTFCARANVPLHHAVKLLEYPKKEHREWAISLMDDPDVKQFWSQLQYMSLGKNGYRDWIWQVQSTQNRLRRFVGSNAIKLFTGLPPVTSIGEWVRNGDIVLINLKPSLGALSPQAAKVFAAIILNGFLNEAMYHANEVREYYLFLDECQNYLTEDAASMLDQVTKSGLRLIFSHHHNNQFPEAIRDHLIGSLDTNAKIKTIFPGLPLPDAKERAEDFWLPEVNERKIKEEIYGTVNDHVLEEHETVSEGGSDSEQEAFNSGFSSGESEGSVGEESTSSSSSGFNNGFFSGTTTTKSRSVSHSTRYAPIPRQELRSRAEWGREDKIAQLATRFRDLKEGEAWVKTPESVYFYQVPRVKDYRLLCPRSVLDFKQALQKHLIPRNEAEQILRDAEKRFLARSKEYESVGRPKKKPARPHEQG